MVKKYLLGLMLVLIANYSPQVFSGERIYVSSLDSAATSNLTKSITKGKYIGGGVAAILPGFGVGHAIQGRYMEKGWIFTVAEVVTLGGAWISFQSSFGDISTSIDNFQETGQAPNSEEIGKAAKSLKKGALFLVLGIAWISVKVYEAIDVWELPSHYKVVRQSSFQAVPLISWNGMSSGLDVGLSLKYKF